MNCRLSYALVFTLPLLLPLKAQGQQQEEDNTFGGWEFVEVNYNFKKIPVFASFYFEHDNFQYQRTECWYTRTTVGVNLLPWLSTDVVWDYLKEPSSYCHKFMLDVTGTLKQGPFKVSIRERLVHTWTPSTGSHSDLLRSRLKVQYVFPHSNWSPYLALETFTWKDWQKSRHYVGCYYNFSKTVQAEFYYIYYVFKDHPAEHVLGIGLNFYF